MGHLGPRVTYAMQRRAVADRDGGILDRAIDVVRIVAGLAALGGFAIAAQPIFAEVLSAGVNAQPLQFNGRGFWQWVSDTADPRGVEVFIIGTVLDAIALLLRWLHAKHMEREQVRDLLHRR